MRASNGSVKEVLVDASTRRLTGRIDVREKHRGYSIFFLEGQVYSVTQDGVSVDTVRRLVTSGALSHSQSAELPHDSAGGVQAAEKGWINVDSLASVHQEFMLDHLGRALTINKPSIHTKSGATSGQLCSIPIEIDVALRLIALRAERKENADALIVAAAEKADVALDDLALARISWTDIEGPPEVIAFVSQCNAGTPIRDIAQTCGFTDAEATYLAALSIGHGMVIPVALHKDPEPTGHERPHNSTKPRFGSVFRKREHHDSTPTSLELDQEVLLAQQKVEALETELTAARIHLTRLTEMRTSAS